MYDSTTPAARSAAPILFPFLALAMPCSPAIAQMPPAASPGATTLGEVIVTATRYERDIETVPGNVSVIDAEQIARSTAQDVPSLLAQYAGLHAYDITGNGRSFRVDRAGFGETAGLNTLVLVDGRPLNSPDLSGADWMLISPERIARIEVVRGSRGSVLYGDNATDGVVNIVTKRGGADLKAGIELAGGSYDTYNPSAYVSGTANGLAYALTGSYYDTQGYRENSYSRQANAGLNLNYDFGEQAALGFSAGYHEDDTGLPGALRESEIEAGVDRTDSTHPYDYADTQDYYAQLTPRVNILGSSYLKMPVSVRTREQEFYSSYAGGDFRGNTHIDTVIASPQAVIQEPIGGLANTLTLGFDFSSADEEIENASSFFGVQSLANFDLGKTESGLYLHDELLPIDRLSLSAGYRWDWVDYEFSPVVPGTGDEADYSENVLTAGATYRILERSYVYLSYSQGFNYPVLDQLFNYATSTVNPDLQPQTSDDYEIGIRHRFNERAYANLNLFRIETWDEIFYNPFTFENENLDATTRRQGVELAAGYEAGRFGLTALYTYRDAEIRGGDLSGNAIPNVPRHQASVNLEWRPMEGLSLGLEGLYVGERYLESDFQNAYPEQDAYTTLNLKLKYSQHGYTAFIDVDNLLNEKYAAYGVLSAFPEEPAYYPSPELSVFAGVRYDY